MQIINEYETALCIYDYFNMYDNFVLDLEYYTLYVYDKVHDVFVEDYNEQGINKLLDEFYVWLFENCITNQSNKLKMAELIGNRTNRENIIWFIKKWLRCIDVNNIKYCLT